MMFRAVQAFGEYAIGDLVDEAKVIEAEAHAFVVRVADDIEAIPAEAEKLAGDVKTEIQGA
jgi:hypothetical protein